jgi:hypothetical protein
MRIKEKLGLRSASELRQKARKWLARSALNRIREEPEPEQGNGTRFTNRNQTASFGLESF